MAESVSVDPQQLRTAAGRLDIVFEESGTALRDTDRVIAECGPAWKDPAATAFGRFTTYLEGRRTQLQQSVAGLSESLATTATGMETQDGSSSSALSQLTSRSSSLDL
ncbi:WXG100 family type VII secretion target [Nocardia bovistercoris]|uniref:WXG100 family type VII secretion target n=1 Tax=Nocardia bovistercoris TaxID=2785916 RepID=A0A931N0E3_9NOCA|nr:WXG100 family type VII secretion target [Nocardia bovistercoris]